MKKKEVIDKVFFTGMSLGLKLGDFGERVAPMVTGKDSKAIEKILKRELADIFKRIEKEMKHGKLYRDDFGRG